MKKDTLTRLYTVLKKDDDMRRVTSYNEIYGVLQDKGDIIDRYVNINNPEDLEIFLDIKKEVMPEEKSPLKIFQDKEMFYYVSTDEKKGIVFNDEKDAYNLFLNIEKTYEQTQELSPAKKR